MTPGWGRLRGIPGAAIGQGTLPQPGTGPQNPTKALPILYRPILWSPGYTHTTHPHRRPERPKLVQEKTRRRSELTQSTGNSPLGTWDSRGAVRFKQDLSLQPPLWCQLAKRVSWAGPVPRGFLRMGCTLIWQHGTVSRSSPPSTTGWMR